MQVKIKINIETIQAVNAALQKVYSLITTIDKVQKVYKSIAYDLADIFDKKFKSKVKKNDLFDFKKKYSMTLKFHEAFALKEILMQLKPTIENHLHQTLVQALIDDLDQKTI